MSKRMLALALALLIPGVCAAGGIHWDCLATPDYYSSYQLAKTPFVFPARGAPTLPAKTPEQVEAYYVKFTFLNAPPYPDAEEVHQLAPASKPPYRTRLLADVEIYLPQRDDERGLGELRRVAAGLGADAVVDVMRLPCVDPAIVGVGKTFWTRYTYHQIVGYGYSAKAVSRR